MIRNGRGVELERHQMLLRRSCAAVLVIYLGAVLIFGTGTGTPSEQRLAAGLGAAAVAVTACVAAVAMLRVVLTSHGRRRRAWLLFAAAAATWCIGAASWATSHLAGDARSATSPGDLWYLLTVALYTSAVLSLPGLQSGRARLRIVIDGAIIGAATAVVIWVVAGRELTEQTDSLLGTASAMLYPSVDIALAVICLGGVAARDRRSSTDSVMFLGGIAFAVIAVGDVTAMFVRAHDVGAAVALSFDAAWCIGLICLAGASGFARPHAEPMRLHLDRRAFAERFAMLPAGAAIAAALVTGIDGLINGGLGSTAIMLLTFTVGLVLVRQTLTLHDNRALGHSLQQAVDTLEHQATHDALTGLPNRAELGAQIERGIARSARRHTLAALLFVDLDHLKAVNDSLGHAAGDQLIVTIAERLKARVGPTVARFGGDEFVVVLDDVPSSRALDALAQAIVDDAAVPTMIDGHTISPSASVGVAIAEVGVEADELLRRADVALYRAKSLGRQRVARYDPDNAADARRQVDLEPDLRRALELDQFEVHYQPVVELTTGRIDGVEALLRWRHPKRGVLSPDAFLPEATTAGLLGEIGGRTLERAFADHAGTERHVAVNLSTIELADPLIVGRVRRALDSSGIDPAMVTLEINEDVIVDGSIRKTIESLRRFGLHLAIDDFGTGNSSLRQLGAYPADYLKVDRTFISRLEFDHDAAVISRAVLQLASGLGLRAIAEGVETDEQAVVLVELGYRSELEELSDRRIEWSDDSVESASPMMRSSSSATVGRSSIAPTT